MIMSGWVYFGITAALFIVLIVLVVHYYKPRKKDEVEHFEKPKYKMLDDDDI
jgi:cbb3-type cytochrome oxidase subunit 3